ncbi:DNA-processing protein DprA [Paracoccus sp. (in: a-proteobacteria)]|uniref:DNA-processing protein DprA n=1 Tax=Paracoccus sp. TaxID=267 RepID=UPI0026DFD7C6|nr:DNA-processing protein DprA [Paracoccus sp. (in: a-proteobacteria)]MDO5371187.1 DNA-processing protein DprA [Paracoccus sp. (in: a-proteobacteria)]
MRQGPVLQAQSLSFNNSFSPRAARDDDLTVLRLIRSRRVGPATFHRLLAEHGSAAAALDALPRIAAEAGIAGYEICPAGVAQAELAAGVRAGARLIRFDDPLYPPLLATIPDAPPVLWLKGRAEALDRPAVAVIGARNASSLGLRMARGLARGLAEAGLTVVAGLARGIDTAAHEASCEAGTLAVMAGGIDVIYPAENRALADRIRENGSLLTEQPPGVEPVARHFPARNRIVSGLSAGVVVIEAAHRSGSLITARCGAEQGREIMAVPGHPLDARAAGCNALIRDGATLVRNSDDVLAALSGAGGMARFPRGGPEGADAPARRKGQVESEGQARRTASESSSPDPAAMGAPDNRRGGNVMSDSRGLPPRNLQKPEGNDSEVARSAGGMAPGDADRSSALRHRLLALLGPSPSDEDSVIRDLGVSPAHLASTILDLELEGRVIRLPGGRIALAT